MNTPARLAAIAVLAGALAWLWTGLLPWLVVGVGAGMTLGLACHTVAAARHAQ